MNSVINMTSFEFVVRIAKYGAAHGLLIFYTELPIIQFSKVPDWTVPNHKQYPVRCYHVIFVSWIYLKQKWFIIPLTNITIKETVIFCS